jgi:hypothetical protein
MAPRNEIVSASLTESLSALFNLSALHLQHYPQECELCGSELNCEVHHIRKLADLNQPGRKEKPQWVKRMAMRRRKTLIVCQKCHEEIHRERPSRRKSTTQITGKPT